MKRSELWFALQDRWEGPHWVLWSLLFGLIGVVLTAVVLIPLALLIGHDPQALTTFGLMIELFGLSLVGSGMLDGVSKKMAKGGLTRDAADMEERLSKEERKRMQEEEKERKDRRTLRAGATVAPIFLAFVVLLFA